MSDRPNGILAYGYDLGGIDAGWKCHNNHPIRTLDAIMNTADEVFKIAGLDISVVMYGSWRFPSFILASKRFEASDWGAIMVEPYLDHSAFERLERACKLLKIEPHQPEPKWILASFYG